MKPPSLLLEHNMNDHTMLATLTCPNLACQHQQPMLMPSTYCQLSYTCEACQATFFRRPGDCCIFCSYADKPCPPKQAEDRCDPDVRHR
ncbi:MAG: hypothetical protein J2P37_13390 [Ktedonobacteraceae bacterium]|nr:hypothetical protein [Ktedonobacteraceae bacterium]MBO0790980.1 hypothetical protein [Ktedonobacteraceae bacterium]